MAGTYTSQRRRENAFGTTDGSAPYIYRTPSSNGFQLDKYNMFRCNEKTTSFRSGGGYGTQLDTPRDILEMERQRFMKPYDTGHEFQTTKTYHYASHKDFTCQAPNLYYRRGPLVALDGTEFGFSDQFPYTFPAVDLSYGTRAIRQTMPTKASANLAQTLSELIVDLPRIPLSAFNKRPGSQFSLHKDAGAEYLNAVFAWQPLVKDVIKIMWAVHNTTQILNQWKRDAGRQVRRAFSFEENVLSSNTKVTDNRAPYGFGYNSGRGASSLYKNEASSKGQLKTTITLTERYWFKGAYTYYLDTESNLWSKMARYGDYADKVLGTKFDIETLWELAPWSWLADWFANVGDLIAVNNAIANDNLVIRYGYLMRTMHWRLTGLHSGVTFKSGPSGPFSTTVICEDKRRVRATPYGFGLNTQAFSTQQWAILAALGMTLGDRKLYWG